MHIYKNIQRLIAFCAAMALPIVAQAQIEDVRAAFDGRHIVAYVVAGFLISVFVMLFYNRVYYFREQQVGNERKRMNAQLAMILESSRTETWTFDVARNTFTRFLEHGQKPKNYIPLDFSQLYNHDDFLTLREMIHDICNWERRTGTLTMRSAEQDDGSVKIYNVTVSVLRHNDRNKPMVLLGTQQDTTENEMRTEQAKKLVLMYQTVFNTSQIDIMYFDANGVMQEINDKACQSLRVKDKRTLLENQPTLADMPALKGIDFNKIERMYSSSMIKTTDIKRPVGEHDKTDRVYYEQNVTTIHNHEGQLAGVVLAGRNITEMVTAQHQQEAAAKQLKATTEAIEAYIRNINYSLKVSDVRLMNYDPERHVLEVSSDLNKTEYRLTQVKLLGLVAPEMRRKVKGVLTRMDNRRMGGIALTVEMLMKDDLGRRIFLNLNLMPITNGKGEVTHYFGMCRNETEMTYMEMQLQEERAKAQETEHLKNTFLLNMSYELRTPLNAVIGFAGLINGPHDEADEPVFAEEIKKNTGTLLQLINDILFISRLDARMIEHTYQVCDFALLFEGWCYMGLTNVAPNVRTIVDNPYNQLMVNIDQQNLALVIQRVCTLSAAHTTEGTIRAKYEYRHGELMITIEDTSPGLSPEALNKIFDRFVQDENVERQGTGLDMPIVRELTAQMGGSIEVQSELGKGTAFYISIPCEMVSFDKKTEII